jgi:predicted secreted protein
MNLASGIAIFFVTWWVCLFMVLPWGVRSHHEEGVEVEAGNEAGAPVKHMLPRKLLATTILACILFSLIYGQLTYHWIGFEDIPFLGGMPKPLP